MQINRRRAAGEGGALLEELHYRRRCEPAAVRHGDVDRSLRAGPWTLRGLVARSVETTSRFPQRRYDLYCRGSIVELAENEPGRRESRSVTLFFRWQRKKRATCKTGRGRRKGGYTHPERAESVWGHYLGRL